MGIVTVNTKVLQDALEVLQTLEHSAEYTHKGKQVPQCPECGGDKNAHGLGPVGHQKGCALQGSIRALSDALES